MVQPGAVQALDALRGEQIAIGDQARQHGIGADVGDDLVELGMQQGLAAAEGDDGRAQPRQVIDRAAS